MAAVASAKANSLVITTMERTCWWSTILGRDIGELTQTIYHESWHRIQNQLLSKQEMAMLNKPRNQSGFGAGWL